MDSSPRIIYRVHAVRRMFERDFSADDIEIALREGETIEEYPVDQPYPSRLVLGRAGGRPVHVVCAEDESAGARIVITVYEPDPRRWNSDFRKRRDL